MERVIVKSFERTIEVSLLLIIILKRDEVISPTFINLKETLPYLVKEADKEYSEGKHDLNEKEVEHYTHGVVPLKFVDANVDDEAEEDKQA